MTTTLEKPLTLETRFNQALKEIRSAGVKARRNVMGCCRGCAIGAGHENDNKPFIEHYGGQGNRMMFEGDYAWYTSAKSSNKPIKKLYFSHDGLVVAGQLTEAGQAVLDAFERNGIVIDWDRTYGMSIIVLCLESVPHRTPHEQALIVNALMDKYGLTANQLLEHNYSYTTLGEYLYELKYDDEMLDGIAKHVRETLDDWAERDREREENNRKRQMQLEINQRHTIRIIELLGEDDQNKMYPQYRVQRKVKWLEITRPFMEYAGEALEDEMAIEELYYRGNYSGRDRMVDDLMFTEIEALPKWASVDYWEAEKELKNKYLIAEWELVRYKNIIFVWDKPNWEGNW